MRISDWSSDVCSSDVCSSDLGCRGYVPRRTRPLFGVDASIGQELAAEAAPARGRKSRAARLHAASPAVTMRRMHRFAFITLLLLVPSLAQAAQPAATVRVGFDRDGVTSTRVHGFADKTTGRRVSAGDPVRIASISKLVTAIGVMRLVEAGKLDVDADAGELLGFPLRNPAFPDTPITLRLLMSHRSSLTDAAGYWQTPLGGKVRDLLDDPRAWDSEHAPGTYFRYTNLNFPLVAQAMERATGERFDRLMDRLVLRPLGIEGCFNWASCSDATVARAVVLYRDTGEPANDDLHGARPDCPVVATEDKIGRAHV